MPAYVLVYSSQLAQRFGTLNAVRRFLFDNEYVLNAVRVGRVKCFPLTDPLTPEQLKLPSRPTAHAAAPPRDPYPARINTGKVVHWVEPSRHGDIALCRMASGGNGSGWHPVVNDRDMPSFDGNLRDFVTCQACLKGMAK